MELHTFTFEYLPNNNSVQTFDTKIFVNIDQTNS